MNDFFSLPHWSESETVKLQIMPMWKQALSCFGRIRWEQSLCWTLVGRSEPRKKLKCIWAPAQISRLGASWASVPFARRHATWRFLFVNCACSFSFLFSLVESMSIYIYIFEVAMLPEARTSCSANAMAGGPEQVVGAKLPWRAEVESHHG